MVTGHRTDESRTLYFSLISTSPDTWISTTTILQRVCSASTTTVANINTVHRSTTRVAVIRTQPKTCSASSISRSKHKFS